MTMSKLAVLALCAAALAGCQLDADSEARAKTAWASACDAARSTHDAYAVLRDGGVLSGSAVTRADAAFTVVETLCGSAPPADLVSATVRVAAAAVVISQARQH